MNSCSKICLTVAVCWLMLMGVVLYALHGHKGTRVVRQTWVDVEAKP